MNKNIEFEFLLGKPVSKFSETIGNDFENKLFKNNFYYIPDDTSKKNFCEMDYNCLSILTDEIDNVQSITIHFREIISIHSYNLLIKKYGKPNNILIAENKQVISESISEDVDFRQHLTKSNFDLKEGTFEENPLYIIWLKENYQIKAFLRYKQKTSEITFSVLTKN
ncbi:hypothetical protein [Gelidibacter pelagius]|uniref:Uncharacterized protein n=1 Tax=Gelidibacter pelagius TaxID=2819985 RepID=A0ABS3SX84_9FLAO|nr:hypothetical protein [Gelidibacter pelagius]MBO3100316.1 hypothetical protein [Gelidibacter pelagius]